MYAAKEPEEGSWNSGLKLNIKMKNFKIEFNNHLVKRSLIEPHYGVNYR